ncbi:MAG: hypothetical protein J1E59_05865 [Treponema sp.]|nr:hypothetical protein [Treponema sp.]
MKQKFFIRFFTLPLLLCAGFVFFSCKSAVTTSYGYENTAYLEIVGNAAKYGASSQSMLVQVVLDKKSDLQFDAQVNPVSKRTVSNKHSYKIAPGIHEIEIFFNGESLLRTSIFASVNQTKLVMLP